MIEKSPCRLFVIMAQLNPVAVILRRGPSAWYHLILWHTNRDEFESGAWFRGRIYKDRCHLSPDGNLFIYFALQGRKWNTSYQGAWTAISRPPWLHALALWPQGHTWGGGGRFLENRKVALWNGCCQPHPNHPPTGLEISSGSGWSFDPDIAKAALSAKQEWIGEDHAGYEIYAWQGKLFRCYSDGDVEIADFNGLEPDPQPAPEWAKAPLRPLRSRKN